MSSSTDVLVATRPPAWRRWIRRGFLLWACIAMGWLANSVRTQGVPAETQVGSAAVQVMDAADMLAFMPLAPASPQGKAALIFFCGSGIAAEAYAPLLRPVAEAGHAVFIVRLPWRFAPLESHKLEALERARRVIAAQPQQTRWVVSGHSLGGALAARLAGADTAGALSALVLIGTTHPKEADLSALRMPVTKVYGSNDGVAPTDRVLANRRLLPPHTTWVEVVGGNHSQFGRYGHQLFDGEAGIGREAQEGITRSALREALMAASLEQPGTRAAGAAICR